MTNNTCAMTSWTSPKAATTSVAAIINQVIYGGTIPIKISDDKKKQIQIIVIVVVIVLVIVGGIITKRQLAARAARIA